jgi:hypothetical protein
VPENKKEMVPVGYTDLSLTEGMEKFNEFKNMLKTEDEAIPATPEGLSQSLTVKSLSAAVIAGLTLIWKSDWAPLGDFTPHIETAVALLLYGLAMWGRMRADKPLKLGGAKRNKETKG